MTSTPRVKPGAKPTRRGLNWLPVIVLAASFFALLAWSTRDAWQQARARQATAQFPDGSLLTVELRTDPNPPLATGTVQVMFMPMNSRSLPVEIDGLTYAYGFEGSSQAIAQGSAELNRSGMYVAPLQFPAVGDYWISATIARGAQTATVRYAVYVEPAQ